MSIKNKQQDFYCPLSPQIPWHWGLIYAACPLGPTERDTGRCPRCKLNDAPNKAKVKSNRKSRPRKPRNRKAQVPKIGKTYTSK